VSILTNEPTLNDIIDMLEGVDEVSLQFRISTLKSMIERNEQRINTIQTQNTGVRSGTVSADIAHYMMLVERDKTELAEVEEKLKEVKDGV
jgi:hypothetical protein